MSQGWIHFEGVEDKSQDDFIKYAMKLSVASTTLQSVLYTFVITTMILLPRRVSYRTKQIEALEEDRVGVKLLWLQFLNRV